MIDTTDTLRLVANRLVNAWNSHDPEGLGSLFAPQYEGVDVSDAAPQRGPEAIKSAFRSQLCAFPDLHVEADQVLIDAPSIAIVWHATGTHTGPHMHIPPTGRWISVRGITVMTVKDGLVRSGCFVWDVAGLLRSLRLLPDL